MHSKGRLLCVACAASLLGAVMLEARPRTIVAGQNVRMRVEVPAGYSFKSQTNQAGIMLVEMENPVWRINVNVLISPEYSPESDKEEWQRNLIVTQSADYLSVSKEQDYKFVPLRPVHGSGVYCVFTDSEAKSVEQLKPDEFMHVVVGAKVIRGAVMYFQIFHNDLKSPEYLEILDVFINSFDEAK